jgi:DNA-binding NarL/FixJ family response regulator
VEPELVIGGDPAFEIRASPEGTAVLGWDHRAVAVTVLIVDDHASFRSRARALLHVGGFEVVGEAEDGASAITAWIALRSDVVLLDIQLPDISGFDVATRLLTDASPPAIVLISSRDAADYGERVEQSGARGFIAKADLSGTALTAVLAAGA